MAKMIRVSEEFHDLIKAHGHDDETMEETLRRLVGGPSPEVLEEIVAGGDEEAAEEIRTAIENRRERSDRRKDTRERFE